MQATPAAAYGPPAPAPASGRQWLRRALLIFVALSVSLPIAFMSLAKLLLVASALGLLVWQRDTWRKACTLGGWQRVALLALAALALGAASLLWTVGDSAFAAQAWVKHLKLLLPVALVLLVRDATDARLLLRAWGAGAVFLLGSSWLLAAGVPIPWTTDPFGRNVVFSSYLDQSIMFAVQAALFWHLRGLGLWPRWLGLPLALAALAGALLLLDGRTGYLTALLVVALAVAWELPARWRLAATLGVPLALGALLYAGSAQWQARVAKGFEEGRNYGQGAVVESSFGWRINAWHRSLQAVAERPLTGHGVGSWAITVKRLQGADAAQVFGEGSSSNPHQEFLLWAVQTGLLGLALLLGLLLAWTAAAWRFAAPVWRASASVLAVLVCACLFNSSLYDDLIGDFFCITLGCLLALGWRLQSDGSGAAGAPQQEPA